MSVELDRVTKAIDELCAAFDDFAAKKGVPGFAARVRPMLDTMVTMMESLEHTEKAP